MPIKHKWTKKRKALFEELVERLGISAILVPYSYALCDIELCDEYDLHFHGTFVYASDCPPWHDDDYNTYVHELRMWNWDQLVDHYHQIPRILLEMGFVEIAARTAEMNRWIDERLSQG